MQRVPEPKGQMVHYVFIALAVGSLGTLWLASRAVIREIEVIPDKQILAADPSHEALQREITSMVQGYPMERMARYIAAQDKIVAAYLVSIAKKESNWGRRVPVGDDGRDCFNYWGYRGPSKETGTGGHTCFNSPRQAVRTVAARIHTLVYEYDRDQPAEMIVWKCGYTCEGHNPESVAKWKSDVAYYFHKFVSETR